MHSHFYKENIKDRGYIYLEDEPPKIPPELLVTALLPENIESVLPLLLLVTVGAGLASLDAPPKMELLLAAGLVSPAVVAVVAVAPKTEPLAVVVLAAKMEPDEAAGGAGLASLAAPPNMLEPLLLPPNKDFEAVALPAAVVPKTDFVEGSAAVVAASPNAGFEVSLADLPDKKTNEYIYICIYL